MVLASGNRTADGSTNGHANNKNANQAKEKPERGSFHLTEPSSWVPKSCILNRGCILGRDSLGIIVNDSLRGIGEGLCDSKSAGNKP
jgi:hypothetical protein